MRPILAGEIVLLLLISREFLLCSGLLLLLLLCILLMRRRDYVLDFLIMRFQGLAAIGLHSGKRAL